MGVSDGIILAVILNRRQPRFWLAVANIDLQSVCRVIRYWACPWIGGHIELGAFTDAAPKEHKHLQQTAELNCSLDGEITSRVIRPQVQ